MPVYTVVPKNTWRLRDELGGLHHEVYDTRAEAGAMAAVVNADAARAPGGYWVKLPGDERWRPAWWVTDEPYRTAHVFGAWLVLGEPMVRPSTALDAIGAPWAPPVP